MNTPPIPGHATPRGTGRYADRMLAAADGTWDPSAYRLFPGLDLAVSKVGFGGYRIHHRSETHRAALRQALLQGCNLIDTSANYGDGGSETLVGEVLRELIDENRLAREEVIVVSKAGYIQGRNMETARRREQEGALWPDTVKYMDGCWHCIHPDFLADQLDGTLARLGCETMDVYLLHNPEYFLADANNRTTGGSLEERREVFYDRVYRAFRFLEQAVRDGRICHYGVSSNTFPTPPSDPAHVALTEILGAAARAAGEVLGEATMHHCRVIQMPCNLLEPGARLERNNSSGEEPVSVLEYAQETGLGVLANRPLNAMYGRELIRLADYSYDPSVDHDANVRARLETLGHLEAKLANSLSEWQISDDTQRQLREQGFFSFGEQIPGILTRLQGREHWEMALNQFFMPGLTHGVQLLHKQCAAPYKQACEQATNGIVTEFSSVVGAVNEYYAWRTALKLGKHRRAIDGQIPEEQRSRSLSQKALNLVTSIPGVTVALCGMRRPEYVTDALEIMAMQAFQDWEAITRSER